MKTIFYSLFIVLSVGTLTSCFDDDVNTDQECLQTLGTVVSDDRQVPEFNAISLAGIADINLTQGSPQSVTLVTHEELVDLVETTVTNQRLDIDMDFCTSDEIDQLVLNITVPDISRLSIFGIGDIASTNDLDVDDLTLSIEGVGNFDLRGTADNLTITSEGIGNVNAFNLTSNNCDVRLDGTGNVEVTVNTLLDVVITGTGNVYYRGNPTVESNILGSGDVIDAN